MRLSARPFPAAAAERGQALMLVVFAMTIIFAVGALAVDIGLWLSEKRGAQSDADFSALAGAQAYLNDLNDTNAAFDDAVEWAIDNGVEPAAIEGSPMSSCSQPNTCINVGTGNCREDGSDSHMPWVESRVRHESRPLFLSIFGVGDGPDIGAVARACVGSPRAMTGLSPFGVQTGLIPPVGPPETGAQCLDQNNQGDPVDSDNDGTVDDGCPQSDCLQIDPADPSRTRPVYGSVCILKMSGGGGGVTGQRGQLTLSDIGCSGTSANQLRHDFHYGSQGFCSLGQEVNTGTGTINGLLQGLRDRLNDEGKCDDLFGDGDSFDEFQEVFGMPGGGGAVVPSPDIVFSENSCSVTTGVDVPAEGNGHVHTFLPRAVHLILIDQLVPNGHTAAITGFAGFYPVGCFRNNEVQPVKQAIEANLADFGVYLNRCPQPTGQDAVIGIFVQTLQPPEEVSDPDPNLPKSIILVK